MGSVTAGSRSKTRTHREGWKTLQGGPAHTGVRPAGTEPCLTAKPLPHHILNSQGAARVRAGVCITEFHGAVGTTQTPAPAGCHALGAGRCHPQEGTKSGLRSEGKHSWFFSGCCSPVQISNAANQHCRWLQNHLHGASMGTWHSRIHGDVAFLRPWGRGVPSPLHSACMTNHPRHLLRKSQLISLELLKFFRHFLASHLLRGSFI